MREMERTKKRGAVDRFPLSFQSQCSTQWIFKLVKHILQTMQYSFLFCFLRHVMNGVQCTSFKIRKVISEFFFLVLAICTANPFNVT